VELWLWGADLVPLLRLTPFGVGRQLNETAFLIDSKRLTLYQGVHIALLVTPSFTRFSQQHPRQAHIHPESSDYSAF